jgi:hypothetical protein
LFQREVKNAELALLNIQNDFSRISFPIQFQVNSFFISFISSLILSTLIYFYVIKSFKVDKLELIFSSFVKLFLIYSGVLFFVLYTLRLYNLSRGLTLVSIFIYPIIFYFLLFLLEIKTFNKLTNTRMLKIIPFLILSILIILFLNQFNSQQDNLSITSITTTTSTLPIKEISECFEWSGSEEVTSCVAGAKIEIVSSFDLRLNNISIYNEKIYILENNGKIYNFEDNSVFLDLSLKVGFNDDLASAGLYSLAFHPSQKYILVSYADLNNHLVVEKLQLMMN